ncbi:5450_t:CDS:1, partial [Funneliformis mosseae]
NKDADSSSTLGKYCSLFKSTISCVLSPVSTIISISTNDKL